MALTDADILRKLLNNCDPYKPATEQFYVDCNAVRGGAVFSERLCTMLSESEGRIHTLFTGHIGSGKSSELAHLAMKMGQKTPIDGQRRFLPVIVNMSEYLDVYDVTTTDILLAVVAELGEALRTQLGITLQDSYIRKRWDEVKSYLLSSVEINEGELSWGWGKAKVQRMRTDPTARENIREALFPKTSTLIEEINLAFVEARTALKTHVPIDGGNKYHDFVLILDNLERVQRLANYQTVEESQRGLFIKNASLLTSLEAHIVFTLPLSLARSDANQLMLLYGRELFVLPMVKTEQRGVAHLPYEQGRQKLIEILGRRLPAGTAVSDVFTKEALETLLYYSGGHIRSLLIFLRESISYANRHLPIRDETVTKAIAQNAGVIVPGLTASDWNLLAELELSSDQTWQDFNERQSRLLENVLVMEYVNGSDETDVQASVPWYAVNPVLRAQVKFMRAVEARKQSTSTE
jgi:hypothetical protein